MKDIFLNILIIVPAFLLCVLLCRKRNSFFNVTEIIKDHFSIFSECKGQYITFLFLPSIIAIGLTGKHNLNDDIINTINVIISILAAMFFSILAIIATDRSLDSDKEKQTNRNNIILLKQTFNSVMLEIINCVFILIFTTLYNSISNIPYLNRIISFLVYFLLIITLVNIFMILKRLKTIFDNNIG